jgi:hypothetical protein
MLNCLFWRICFLGASDLLVDEQRGLTVSRVAPAKPTARLDELLIEVVRHLGLRIAVHEPEQVAVVVLHAILGGVLLAQKLWCLSVTIMRWPFDVKVLGEVGGRFGTEVATGTQVWVELGWIGLQFLTIGLHVWAGIADAVFIFDANAELVVLEGFQVGNFTATTLDATASGKPIAVGQLEHFHLATKKGEGIFKKIRTSSFWLKVCIVDSIPF